jgi:hypothetical protein
MSESESRDFKSLAEVFAADEDGIFDTPNKPTTLSSNERIVESFQEINDFYRTHGREPDSGVSEIDERKLGARLEGFRIDDERKKTVASLDQYGLLSEREPFDSIDQLLQDPTAAALFGDPLGLLDLSSLPQRATRVEPEEIASRVRCDDFDKFEPLFKQKHEELRANVVKLVPFSGQSSIVPGAFFVLAGVMLFVSDLGERIAVPGKRTRVKRRTRTIYENGTESRLFERSLASQLYENDGLQLVPANFDPLFEDDNATGWIYVLKSLSDDPRIAELENLYKIGFSTVPVKQRISNARNETTYLMAEVEVVAEYRTYNLKVSSFEHLLHRVFADVRLAVGQLGKDGKQYQATEWFVAPLHVVNQAVQLIVSGEIVEYVYDKDSSRLVEKAL